MWTNIPETNTKGAHTYVVAMCCGGIMEDPSIHYEHYQLIHANSAAEAKRKYDKLNSCSYYYGRVMGQID